MDFSYISPPEPRHERLSQRKRERSIKTKRETKPKRQYIPVRGYCDEFAVDSRKGISSSPDSVMDLVFGCEPRSLPIEIPAGKPYEIPQLDFTEISNPNLSWKDVVKHGVEFAEWEHVPVDVDYDVFVLDM